MTSVEFSSEHSHTGILYVSLLEMLTWYVSWLVFIVSLTQPRVSSEEGTSIGKLPLSGIGYLG